MIKLFKYLKPFALPLAGVLVLVFGQTLAELYLPTLMSDIVDHGIMKSDIAYIWQIGGFMLIVTFGSMIAAILSSYLSSITAMGFGKRLRSLVFSRVSSFSLNEFDKFGTATLITRTTNDITQVQMVTMIILRMMVMAPMMCIGGVIMALSKDVPLTLILAVVIPILVLLIVFVAVKGLPLFRAMQKKIDKINLVLRENLTGIRVIRAFNRVSSEQKRFDEANQDLTKTALKVNRLMTIMMPAMTILMNYTSIAIIWFGGIRIDQGAMEIGSLMAFLQYIMQIMFSLLMVSMMFVMVPRASASATRINEVLGTEPTIIDPKEPKKLGSARGQLEFRNVTFSYPGAEAPALSNISFTAGPGETTAIIGGTGCGKSTLVELIPRFYDIDSGSLLVDGVDIREMSQADLRKKIGLVSQRAIIFSGSVRDNIKFGKEEASDEEIRVAAETAQASEFIQAMGEGMDSKVAQGGTTVSGGQKQRLSIARALARKPEIYIFDDSFSALDFKTDAKLRAALKKQTTDSTVIIVAQRVSTVMDADRIIVLEEGRVVGIGRHKELMGSCDVYREIVSSQLGEEEIA